MFQPYGKLLSEEKKIVKKIIFSSYISTSRKFMPRYYLIPANSRKFIPRETCIILSFAKVYAKNFTNFFPRKTFYSRKFLLLKYPVSLRFVFTKRNAMWKPAIVNEREKNAKKLTMKNVLNDQKYHEILQNSKILHTQSKLQGEIFKLAKFCNKRIILKSSKQR